MAHAHVLYGRPTLASFASGADAVLVAEITAEATPWAADDGSARCDALRAKVIKTLNGPDLPGRIDFFVHAEGDPRFSRGDRVLLFLERTDGRKEFAGLAGRFPWYTAQGPGQEWHLDEVFGETRLESARGWLEARDVAAVRQVLLGQLRSGDPRLHEDAILEMVRFRRNAGFFASAEDVAPFREVLDDGALTTSQARALQTLLPHRPVAPRFPILANRVGRVVLGEPLPASSLGADLAGRYRARVYADAQPIEGFVFDTPPLLALVEGGPYEAFGHAHPAAAVPDEVRERAVEQARGGVLTVSMIVITSDTLRTTAGVGVGSAYADVVGTYPEARTMILPALWEEPSCVVEIGGRDVTTFFFANCVAREEEALVSPSEAVIRVVLRRRD